MLNYIDNMKNGINKYILDYIFFSFFIILIYFSFYNYLIFHTIIEIFTIVIGYSIMIIAFNTYSISQNSYFNFLGIAYAFVGSIDLVHVFTYKGMTLLIKSPDISIQLWVAARYLESISILISFAYFHKKMESTKIMFIYVFTTILIILSIFKFNIFPVCFVAGYGLTKFKIISEYIISAIFILSLYILNKKYKKNISQYKIYSLSILFSILSEISFTSYNDVYGLFNLIGHVFKAISFYLLYKAVVREIIRKPFGTIFYNLKIKTRELAKTNYKYKKLLNFLPDAVILREGEIIAYINNKALELLNLNNKEEIIGKKLLSIIHEDYKDIVKKRFNMECKEKLMQPVEEKFITSDKKVIDVEVSAISVYLQNKEYYLLIIRDITNKKKVQEMKLKLQESIEKDRIKTEFFANISHELKTPINLINSALQLEDIYINKNDFASIKEYNKVIKQSCSRLLRISNNIIDITKIDSGFLKVNFSYINIVSLAENIVMSVISYIENKGINVVFDTEIEEEYIKCDLEFMERILLNLISNSIKYRKDNGNISVNIYLTDNGYVNISVKDDGIGIPQEKQESIFNRFNQLDKIFTRRCEGFGIGLSLVKSLVEIQKGKLKLVSKENIGTEVIISFPIAELDEIACTNEMDNIEIEEHRNIIEKVNIEFSDIYL